MNSCCLSCGLDPSAWTRIVTLAGMSLVLEPPADAVAFLSASFASPGRLVRITDAARVRGMSAVSVFASSSSSIGGATGLAAAEFIPVSDGGFGDARAEVPDIILLPRIGSVLGELDNRAVGDRGDLALGDCESPASGGDDILYTSVDCSGHSDLYRRILG